MKRQPFVNDDKLSTRLEDNQRWLQDQFSDCDDLVIQFWQFGGDAPSKLSRASALTIYMDTLISNQAPNRLRTLLDQKTSGEANANNESGLKQIIGILEHHSGSENHTALMERRQQVVDALLSGNVVILIEGWHKAFVYDAYSVESRNVEEPLSESVVLGPREGTVDRLQINVGLLRSRLRSPAFKIKKLQAGGTTRTEMAYGYVEGIVPEETLSVFEQRLERIRQVEVLESSYVEEVIEDSKYSPFPQFRKTERPDAAVADLLEGRIVVLVQGTGMLLTCPCHFSDFFQSSEDYYQRILISSVIRWLRILAFFIALTLPGIYIALTTFHPELIPTVLLLAIADIREGIPFPALVEAFIMQFFFELLREAGVRLPKPVGSAVSIVGALVIGEAAISAGIASPIMVVIVALTGIASFALPQYSIAIPLRILQFPLMIMAATFGIFGMLIGMLFIVLHLTNLRSLEQPYFEPFAPLRSKGLRDTIVRKSLVQTPGQRHS